MSHTFIESLRPYICFYLTTEPMPGITSWGRAEYNLINQVGKSISCSFVTATSRLDCPYRGYQDPGSRKIATGNDLHENFICSSSTAYLHMWVIRLEERKNGPCPVKGLPQPRCFLPALLAVYVALNELCGSPTSHSFGCILIPGKPSVLAS